MKAAVRNPSNVFPFDNGIDQYTGMKIMLPRTDNEYIYHFM